MRKVIDKNINKSSLICKLGTFPSGLLGVGKSRVVVGDTRSFPRNARGNWERDLSNRHNLLIVYLHKRTTGRIINHREAVL